MLQLLYDIIITVLTGWKFDRQQFEPQPTILLLQHSTSWEIPIACLFYYTIRCKLWIAMNETQATRWSYILSFLRIGVIPIPMMKSEDKLVSPGAKTCDRVVKSLELLEFEAVPPIFTIAPDGTRDPGEWKTGWYTIFRQLPGFKLQAVAMDFRRHEILMSRCYTHSDTRETIESEVKSLFANTVPLYPKTLNDDRARTVFDYVTTSVMVAGISCITMAYLEGYKWITIYGFLFTVVAATYHVNYEQCLGLLDLLMNIILGSWSAVNCYLYPPYPKFPSFGNPFQLFAWCVYAYLVIRSWGRAGCKHRSMKYVYYHTLSHLWGIVVCATMMFPSPIEILRNEWSKSLDVVEN
jgi:hypothetical protein